MEKFDSKRFLMCFPIKQFVGFLFVNLGCFALVAQDAVPRGGFHERKAKLGEPIVYSLVFRHSPNLEVVFPDSSYNFAPFELLQKDFFPTQTDSLGSYDSVAYTLATYELDKVQYLSLPILLPSKTSEDFEKVFSDKDSIQLVEIVKVIPEEKKTFEDTSLVNVEKEFNYPYLLIGLAILLTLAVVIFLSFGGKVREYFKRKRLEKAHLRFVARFEQLVSESPNSELDKPIALWKKYTGDLMNIPLESYTTKEIDSFVNNQQLIKVLREADRAIYSGNSEINIKKEFSILKAFTAEEYEKKLEKEFGEIEAVEQKVTLENSENAEVQKVETPKYYESFPAREKMRVHALFYALISCAFIIPFLTISYFVEYDLIPYLAVFSILITSISSFYAFRIYKYKFLKGVDIKRIYVLNIVGRVFEYAGAISALFLGVLEILFAEQDILFALILTVVVGLIGWSVGKLASWIVYFLNYRKIR